MSFSDPLNEGEYKRFESSKTKVMTNLKLAENSPQNTDRSWDVDEVQNQLQFGPAASNQVMAMDN